MRATCLIKTSPHYRREAFEKGLKRAGYTLTTSMVPAKPGDALVVWNRMRGSAEQACERWEQAGGVVIVAENGYLQKAHGEMYALSLGQHNGAGKFPVGSEDRFSKLGFEVKPWRTGGREIVVCAQRGIGSRLMASPPGWAEQTAMKLRSLTKLPVRIRQHPGLTACVPLERDLEHAAACVIWSSGAGVRALVEGVPVFYAAPHWICAWAAWPLREFGVPPIPFGRQWALNTAAWGQWHHEEIASGEPFVRLKEMRK